MHRPSRARRRFHTDRVVRSRRTRYFRVHPDRIGDPETERRLSYGRLASTSPWDCGNPACGVCDPIDYGWRRREERDWRGSYELRSHEPARSGYQRNPRTNERALAHD